MVTRRSAGWTGAAVIRLASSVCQRPVAVAELTSGWRTSAWCQRQLLGRLSPVAAEGFNARGLNTKTKAPDAGQKRQAPATRSTISMERSRRGVRGCFVPSPAPS